MRFNSLIKSVLCVASLAFSCAILKAEDSYHFEDYLSTFDDEHTVYDADVTTDAGWWLNYTMVKNISTEEDEVRLAVTLSGKADIAGEVVSPTLENGIGALWIDYMCYYADSQMSLTINIKKDEEVVKSIICENSEVERYKEYTFKALNIDVEGDFVIEILNNCPSQNTKAQKDRVSLLNLRWTNYPEATAECNLVEKEYEIGDVVEFDAPDGVDVLYCFNGDPDYKNIFTESQEAANSKRRVSNREDGVTYSHTTHPLVYEGDPITVNYVAYSEGKQPSTVKVLKVGDNTSTQIIGVVMSEDCGVEYYDLSGRTVKEPTCGVYIVRKGLNVSKVVK